MKVEEKGEKEKVLWKRKRSKKERRREREKGTTVFAMGRNEGKH